MSGGFAHACVERKSAFVSPGRSFHIRHTRLAAVDRHPMSTSGAGSADAAVGRRRPIGHVYSNTIDTAHIDHSVALICSRVPPSVARPRYMALQAHESASCHSIQPRTPEVRKTDGVYPEIFYPAFRGPVLQALPTSFSSGRQTGRICSTHPSAAPAVCQPGPSPRTKTPCHLQRAARALAPDAGNRLDAGSGAGGLVVHMPLNSDPVDHGLHSLGCLAALTSICSGCTASTMTPEFTAQISDAACVVPLAISRPMAASSTRSPFNASGRGYILSGAGNCEHGLRPRGPTARPGPHRLRPTCRLACRRRSNSDGLRAGRPAKTTRLPGVS